jgi:hypothetical protein
VTLVSLSFANQHCDISSAAYTTPPLSLSTLVTQIKVCI